MLHTSTAATPATRILIVTDARDDAALVDLLSAGVAGLLSGTTRATSPARVRELLVTASGAARPRVLELAAPRAGEPVLTDRQRDVLALVARGQSNKEIARDLGVSPSTVKTHVAQLIAILSAANRTDAAMKARAAGLL